jgi:hypothetical protein
MMKFLTSFRFTLLFCILFLMTNYATFCQGKISLETGYGFPECLYLGVGVPLKQFQFEFTGGGFPHKYDNEYSFATNIYYYFAGKPVLSERKPWYAKTGMVYYHDKSEYRILKYLYWSFRLGREFNPTKHLGISIDAGLIYECKKWKIKENATQSSLFNIHLDFPVVPSAGVHIFCWL